jgi:hypothetical protein
MSTRGRSIGWEQPENSLHKLTPLGRWQEHRACPLGGLLPYKPDSTSKSHNPCPPTTYAIFAQNMPDLGTKFVFYRELIVHQRLSGYIADTIIGTSCDFDGTTGN